MDNVRYARVGERHGEWWYAWGDEGICVTAPGDLTEEEFRRRLPAGAESARGAAGDLPDRVDWAALPGGFLGDVLRACAAIPAGEVRSYAELAAAAGRPRAVRAAGHAMAVNPVPNVVPCHRVIRSDGRLGNYGAGGSERKAVMLRAEGVAVEGDRVGRREEETH